jgi:hypothetical protein
MRNRGYIVAFETFSVMNGYWRPIPKCANALPSAADGVWPEVKTMRTAGARFVSVSAPACGPLKSSIRRAMAGAGSM